MAPIERASKVAVIIPALNEELGIPGVLAELFKQQPPPYEVIVVDGGSVDKTAKVAAAAGARVVESGRGRAVQMNAGAAAATEAEAEILLFLHADTMMEPGALAAVQKALHDPSAVGGCFQLRFDAERQSFVLWLWGWATRSWLFRTPRLVFGDRALFVRRSIFESMGGFVVWPLLEDCDFALRLWKIGGTRGFKFLPMDVVTSARRLLEVGPLWQQLRNTLILSLWYMGISPFTLKSMYMYKIPLPTFTR